MVTAEMQNCQQWLRCWNHCMHFLVEGKWESDSAFLAPYLCQCNASDFSGCHPDLHLCRSMFILPF